MKVGLKLYTRTWKYLSKLDFADFIEVLVIPRDKSLRKFRDYSYKYTIHAAHNNFGFNPADLSNRKRNAEIIKAAVGAADYLNAGKIIVHSGFTNQKLEIKNGVKNSLDFFGEFYDKRFHFENVLYKEHDNTFFGHSIGDTKEFLKKMKFCLDFGHAINAAYKEKTGYKEFILKLYKLNPDYFHLCGNIVGKRYDKTTSHLSIFDGNDDIEFYKNLIKKRNKDVCLETPLDVEQRRKEYLFMKS